MKSETKIVDYIKLLQELVDLHGEDVRITFPGGEPKQIHDIAWPLADADIQVKSAQERVAGYKVETNR